MSFTANWAVRDLHVAASPLACVRHVAGKLDSTIRRDRRRRAARHSLYRQALQAHTANARLYSSASGGLNG